MTIYSSFVWMRDIRYCLIGVLPSLAWLPQYKISWISLQTIYWCPMSGLLDLHLLIIHARAHGYTAKALQRRMSLPQCFPWLHWISTTEYMLFCTWSNLGWVRLGGGRMEISTICAHKETPVCCRERRKESESWQRNRLGGALCRVGAIALIIQTLQL